MIFKFIDALLIILSASTISYEVVLFSRLAAWCWYPLFLFTSAGIYILIKKLAPKEYIPISNKNILLLSIVATLCMCINIFTFRPDNDDFSFIHRAMVIINDIHSPIPIFATAFDKNNLPPISPAHIITSIETSSVLTAHAFGISPMFFTHYIIGSLSLFLFPIILFALFSSLGFSQRESLIATVIAIIIYASTGDNHADWGNFTLVRSWQGKTIYMILLAPLTTMLTLMCFNNLSSRVLIGNDLIRLYCIGIASVGLTGTGFFIYPFVIFSIFFIWIFYNRKKVHIIPSFFVLTTTLVFSLLLVLLIKLSSIPQVANTDIWKLNNPTSGIYHNWLFDEWYVLFTKILTPPTTAIFYVVSLALSFLLFKLNNITKLFLSSSLLMFFCIITPPISSFIIKICLPSPYWRLVYSTNMLLVIVVFITYCLFYKAQPQPIINKFFKTTLHNTKIYPYFGCIFLISYCLIKTPAINSSIFSMPLTYKFYKNTYPVTKTAIKKIPLNAIGIAEENVLVSLSLQRADLKFMVTRPAEVLHIFTNSDENNNESELRLQASFDIKGCGSNGALKELLNKYNDISFLILPAVCTEEQIKENMGINFDDWDYEFIDDIYKLLLHKNLNALKSKKDILHIP